MATTIYDLIRPIIYINNINEINEIKLEEKRDDNMNETETYFKLNMEIIYKNNQKVSYESKDYENKFFNKLNYLIYKLMKKTFKNVLIEIKDKPIPKYYILNYLFQKFKNDNVKIREIILFINKNFLTKLE